MCPQSKPTTYFQCVDPFGISSITFSRNMREEALPPIRLMKGAEA